MILSNFLPVPVSFILFIQISDFILCARYKGQGTGNTQVTQDSWRPSSSIQSARGASRGNSHILDVPIQTDKCYVGKIHSGKKELGCLAHTGG